MLRVANGFARGTAGVRPLLAERIVAALNAGEHPRVRLLGSVGQSDLPPLADLAHGLSGEVELQAKEGLALLNSNAFSTGIAALAVADTERLLDALDVSGALDLEAFAANVTMLHPAVGLVRPYEGIRFSLARLRKLLEGSYLWEAGRRAQPAGPAHLPLPAADPRSRPRHARLRAGTARDRAQRVAGEPARDPRGGADRLGRRTPTRSPSRARSTSSASRSRRCSRVPASGW